MIGAPSDVIRWEKALDDYEAALAAHRALLEAVQHGSTVELPAPFLPPLLLTPVPAALHERAQHLLEETNSVVALADEIARAARPVGMSPRRFAGRSTAPSVLDRVL